MNALEVHAVSKAFKSSGRVINAVCDANFTVCERETVGLLGMNGAGKSTVVKMCTGLLRPDEGSISVFGHDIVSERESAVAMLNVSPQETAVAFGLTVLENLMLVSEIYGADKRNAQRAAQDTAERLGLSDRLKDRAGKLSGGLMRRLSIGMAVITKPKLLFLDEPTLGLDVVARHELWRLIRELKKDTAVVLTTHYLEEAEALCERIVIMDGGKITAIGSGAELMERSGQSTFENAFLALTGKGDYIDGGNAHE